MTLMMVEAGISTVWCMWRFTCFGKEHTEAGRRLPADRGLRTPRASLRSRQRPHCSVNKHSTWRQEFLGCGSENLKQSTRLTAAA